MTFDPRFQPPPRGKDCLNCVHHTFDEGVACNHPDRPNAPVQIIRWAFGCPQHVPLEEQSHE